MRKYNQFPEQGSLSYHAQQLALALNVQGINGSARAVLPYHNSITSSEFTIAATHSLEYDPLTDKKPKERDKGADDLYQVIDASQHFESEQNEFQVNLL
jgi:hypothetical protein